MGSCSLKGNQCDLCFFRQAQTAKTLKEQDTHTYFFLHLRCIMCKYKALKEFKLNNFYYFIVKCYLRFYIQSITSNVPQSTF